jgi:hypothetical protein
MANGALSGYFEKQKEKADRVGPSPYASSDGAAPAAPAPTAAPAPAAAPSAQKAGGTGFVNFGTYFGANAPAIQAQAQKAAGGGGGALQAYGTAQGLPSQGQGGNVNFRPGTSLSSLGKGQSSIDQGIARTQAQMGNLAPAMTGDMGKGTSLFDQMLGGATTKQAAESRFKALEQQLGAQQGEKRRVEAETAQKADAAAKAAAKESARKQWMENLPTQLRYNYTPEELQQMFEEEYASGAWTQTTPAMVSTPASEL